jgi:PAS domain-containing protein
MELQSNTEVSEKKVKRKGGLKLFRRLPKLRWQPTESAPFIPLEKWNTYPDLIEDFKLLEEQLMRRFHKFDNQSLRAQNTFRLQQLVLLIGSAVAAILGAIQIALINSLIPGVLETLITIFLACMTYIVRSFNAQRDYFTYRLIAETLREEYYLFLGRIGEYADAEKRLLTLKRRVSEITGQKQREREGSRKSFADTPPVEMINRDKQFLDLYNQYRYSSQLDYYEARTEEFEGAQYEFVLSSAILMGLAAVMSVLASLDLGGLKLLWAVLAVIFPTLSAALSTYNTLYAFERQAKIYRDAFLRLESAEHKLQSTLESKSRQEMLDFVDEVERVFLEERGQWGLLADNIKLPEPPMPQS